MNKELTKLIMAALSSVDGFAATDHVREQIADALGGVQPDAAGYIESGSGNRLVRETDYNELHADLRKLRKRAQDAERERDELRSDAETGHNRFKSKLEAATAELEAMRPRWDALMARTRADWTERVKQLPEDKPELRAKFTLVEGDTKELTDEQVLENLARWDEYSALGILAPASPPAPGAPPPTQLRTGGPAQTKPGDVDVARAAFYNKPGAVLGG